MHDTHTQQQIGRAPGSMQSQTEHQGACMALTRAPLCIADQLTATTPALQRCGPFKERQPCQVTCHELSASPPAAKNRPSDSAHPGAPPRCRSAVVRSLQWASAQQQNADSPQTPQLHTCLRRPAARLKQSTALLKRLAPTLAVAELVGAQAWPRRRQSPWKGGSHPEN
jgi:hypothetical protein